MSSDKEAAIDATEAPAEGEEPTLGQGAIEQQADAGAANEEPKPRTWLERNWERIGFSSLVLAAIGPVVVILLQGSPKLYFALITASAGLIAFVGGGFRLAAHDNDGRRAWDGLGKWLGFSAAALALSGAVTVLLLNIQYDDLMI